MKHTHNRQGFTLIELLVVIAIIGILSTMAIIALGSARIKSRDAKRVADIRQLISAMELFYNDATVYPTNVTSGQALSFETTTYMAVIPTNPSPNNDGNCPANTGYLYTPLSSNTSYIMTFCIGGATGELAAGTHRASPNGIQ